MGFKEAIAKMGQKRKESKELLKRMLEQDKLESIVQERKLSSNERELNGYYKENHEKGIKEQLEEARKKRREDISFNHQPLNVKNITNSTEWEVLKEKNMFSKKGNMFQGHGNIHKSNKKLMNSGNVLHGRSNLFKHKGGGLI